MLLDMKRWSYRHGPRKWITDMNTDSILKNDSFSLDSRNMPKFRRYLDISYVTYDMLAMPLDFGENLKSYFRFIFSDVDMWFFCYFTGDFRQFHCSQIDDWSLRFMSHISRHMNTIMISYDVIHMIRKVLTVYVSL